MAKKVEQEKWPKEWPKDNRKVSRRGKTIATEEAVAEAVQRIVAREERPTIHRVMAEIGGGSMTTISRLLKQMRPEVSNEEAKKLLAKRREFAPGVTCLWFPYYRRIVIPFLRSMDKLAPAREIQLWREVNPFLEANEYEIAFKLAGELMKVHNEILTNDEKEELIQLEHLEALPPEDLWELVRHRQRKVIGQSGETLLFFHTRHPIYDFILLGFLENGNEMTFMGQDSFQKLNGRVVQNIFGQEGMTEIMKRIETIEKKLNLPWIRAQRKPVWFDREIEEQIQKSMQVRDIGGLKVCTAEAMVGAQMVTIAVTPAYDGWRPVDTLVNSEEKVREIFAKLNPGSSLGMLDLARQLSAEVAKWGRKIKIDMQQKVFGISIDDACKILEGLLLDENAETQPRYDPKYFWAYFDTRVAEKLCRVPCIWDEETETVSDIWEQAMLYGAPMEIVFGIYRRFNPDGHLMEIMEKGSEIISRASGFRVKPKNLRYRPSRPKALFDWQT